MKRTAILIVVSLAFTGCNLIGFGDDSSKKYLASNVLLSTSYRVASLGDSQNVDTTTEVLASNVIYQNAADEADLEADNVEGALTEANLDLEKHIVGRWNVTNIGTNATGVVKFSSDGTYNIESGSFTGGGSWYDATHGSYEVIGNIIGMTYNNWTATDYAYSRFSLVLHKRMDTVTIATQGHTHGIEVFERIE